MKRKVSVLIILALLVTSIVPVYASAALPQQQLIVLPQGKKLDDIEMTEIKGEIAPRLVGAVVGGLTNASLQVVDNYLNGERGMDLLEGCGKQIVVGAAMGAIAPPTKTVMETVGVLTAIKKVYDTSKIGVSVGAGVAGYVAGEVYDKVTE